MSVKIATANPSTAQTNTALVAADTARQLKVVGIYVSSDTALTVTLSSSASHTALLKQYVAANGGQVHISAPLPLALPEWGEGLDYSTSANGNVWITVLYEIG